MTNTMKLAAVVGVMVLAGVGAGFLFWGFLLSLQIFAPHGRSPRFAP